jgi:ABC-2 type transport system permease protein
MLQGNKGLEDVISRLGGSGAVVDAYLASTMTLFGLMASGYAIQATLKLRTEEASGRAEPVLAMAVGRVRWAASHFALSLLGSCVVLASAGLSTGLAYGSNTGRIGHELMRLGVAAMAQLPAVWVLAALTIALVGVLPRLASAAWGALAAFFLLALVGTAMQWNERVLELSPFVHIPRVPGGPFSAAPLLWLTLVAVAVTAAGLMALRRRNIPVG